MLNLLCVLETEQQSLGESLSVYNSLLNTLNPLLLRKRKLRILLLVNNVSGHPRALMEMRSTVSVFMRLFQHSIYSVAMDEGVISTFKSYYLRNFVRIKLP